MIQDIEYNLFDLTPEQKLIRSNLADNIYYCKYCGDNCDKNDQTDENDKEDDQDDEKNQMTICNNRRSASISLYVHKNLEIIDETKCEYDCSCDFCKSEYNKHPLDSILSFSNEITEEMYNKIERIYGKLTMEEWFLTVIRNVPNTNKLPFYIEKGLIDPNYVIERMTLINLYSVGPSCSYEKSILYYIINYSGFNINIQNEDGDNILLYILKYDSYYDKPDFYPTDREDKYLKRCNDRLLYFLQNGADPLLENKEGISAVDYARNLKTFPQETKDDLIKLLEPYC